MKALLEFVWRGVNISNFIDTDLIINDYNDTDTFLGVNLHYMEKNINSKYFGIVKALLFLIRVELRELI